MPRMLMKVRMVPAKDLGAAADTARELRTAMGDLI
jgi:hypothetical protein